MLLYPCVSALYNSFTLRCFLFILIFFSSSLSLKCALRESGCRIGNESTKMSRDHFWRSISRDTSVDVSAFSPIFWLISANEVIKVFVPCVIFILLGNNWGGLFCECSVFSISYEESAGQSMWHGQEHGGKALRFPDSWNFAMYLSYWQGKRSDAFNRNEPRCIQSKRFELSYII